MPYTISTSIATYTLNGVAYPLTGSGSTYASIGFVFATNTTDFTYVNDPGGSYFLDTTGTTSIYVNGVKAAIATNPQELRFFYPNTPTFVLTDTATLQNVLSGTITTFGNGTADPAGLLNVVANSPGGGFTLDTIAGPLIGEYANLGLSTSSASAPLSSRGRTGSPGGRPRRGEPVRRHCAEQKSRSRSAARGQGVARQGAHRRDKEHGGGRLQRLAGGDLGS